MTAFLLQVCERLYICSTLLGRVAERRDRRGADDSERYWWAS